MDLIEVLRLRKSCRSFKGHRLTEAQIGVILGAMVEAPYASGGPRFKCLVVNEKDKLMELQKACQGQAYVGTCGAAFVMCGTDVETKMMSGHAKYIFDVSAATMCMDLKATSLGFGTCWIGWFNRKEVQLLLNTNDRPTIILLVGEPRK